MSKIEKCLITGEPNVSNYGKFGDYEVVVSAKSNFRYKVSGSVLAISRDDRFISPSKFEEIVSFSETTNNEVSDFPLIDTYPSKPKFVSTKTYKEIGPVAYRQWRAESHCNILHGYSLSFHIEFESDNLDVRNWVVDFGSLRSFKDKLEEWFDHRLLVAEDDPEFETFKMLEEKGLAKLTVVERTGCEGLAQFLFDYLEEYWLPDNGYKGEGHSVDVRKVEVRETGGNMAYVTKN